MTQQHPGATRATHTGALTAGCVALTMAAYSDDPFWFLTVHTITITITLTLVRFIANRHHHHHTRKATP